MKFGLDSSIIELPHLAHFIHYVLHKECQDQTLLQDLTEDRILEQLNNPKQRTLLLLDGYDEVEMLLQVKDTQEQTLAGSIFEALLKQPDYVLTSRPYAVQKSQFPLPKHYYYELLGFTDANIPTYITRVIELMKKPAEEAHTLIQLFRKNPSIWGTAHVPIHLAIICAVLRPGVFVNCEFVTMSMLYQELTRQLGKRFFEQQCHLQVNGLQSSEIEDKMEPLANFLGELALEGLVQNTLIFDYNMLKPIVDHHQTMLGAYLARFKPSAAKTKKELQNHPLLSLLKPIIKTGFLHAVNPHETVADYVMCYFPHASFQEYFAAFYIVKWLRKEIKTQYKLNQKVYTNAKNFIKATLEDPHYEIVYWFVAGFLQKVPLRLEQYLDIIINNLQEVGLADKAKRALSSNDSRLVILVDRLLKEDKKFRYLLQSLRCLEEAGIPTIKRKAELMQLYKAVIEELFITQANLPFHWRYRLLVEYLKLSPNLLNKLNVIALLTNAKVSALPEISMRLDLTLSQLAVEDVVDSLIRVINNSEDISLRCQAIESLSLVANFQEWIRIKENLLQYLDDKVSRVSMATAKALLCMQQKKEVLYWLISFLLRDDLIIKMEVIQFLLDIEEDNLVAQWCQFDLVLKEELLRATATPQSSTSRKPDIKEVKLILLGNACGKSDLLLRFVKNRFIGNLGPTIEDSYRKTITINNKNVILDLLDVSGCEEYSKLRDMFIKEAYRNAIVCFAINDKYSFKSAIEYCEHLDKFHQSKPILVAGLRKDLEDRRQISFEEGLTLANLYQTNYIECSALTGENVTRLFTLAAEIASNRENMTSQLKVFSQRQDRLKAILFKPITVKIENQWIDILKELEQDKNEFVKKQKSLLLNGLEISALKLIRKISDSFSTKAIQQISKDQLLQLEKYFQKEMAQIYIKNLVDSNSAILKTLVARLHDLTKSHEPEAIAAYFKLLSGYGAVREFAEEIIMELDITQLNEEQRSILFDKICLRYLCNPSIKIRSKVLSKLQQLGKLEEDPEIIAAYIENINNANVSSSEMAARKLSELEPRLSEAQRENFYRVCLGNLCHSNARMQQEALKKSLRLAKVDALKLMKVYTDSLPDISRTALLNKDNMNLHCLAIKNLWPAFNKQNQITFKENLLGYLQGKITPSTMMVVIILLQIGYSEEVSLWLIKLCWCNDTLIQRSIINCLINLNKFKLLGQLYHADPLFRSKLLEISELPYGFPPLLSDEFLPLLSDKEKIRIKEMMEQLANDDDESTADRAKQILIELSNQDIHGLNARMYIDNVILSSNKILQSSSIEQLAQLEKSHPNKLMEVYIKKLQGSNATIIKFVLSRLGIMGKLLEPQVIAAHFDNLVCDNKAVRAITKTTLFEIDMQLLNEDQRNIIYKIFLENLENSDETVYTQALKRLECLKKLYEPEVVTILFGKIIGTNITQCEAAYCRLHTALTQFSLQLDETQQKMIYEICLKNLSHYSEKIRNKSLEILKHLGKLEALEIIEKLIGNLTHPNADVILTADFALFDLGIQLNKEQSDHIYKSYIKNLLHSYYNIHQNAISRLKMLGKAGSPEVTAAIKLRRNPFAETIISEIESPQISLQLDEMQQKMIYDICLKSLSHHSEKIRNKSLKTLEHLGKLKTSEVIEKLINNLNHPNESVIFTADFALFDLGIQLNKEQSDYIYKIYIKNLFHPNFYIRQNAISRLEKLGKAGAPEVIAAKELAARPFAAKLSGEKQKHGLSFDTELNKAYQSSDKAASQVKEELKINKVTNENTNEVSAVMPLQGITDQTNDALDKAAKTKLVDLIRDQNSPIFSHVPQQSGTIIDPSLEKEYGKNIDSTLDACSRF